MKSIIFVYIVMVSMVFSSCNYLDVMPDERAKLKILIILLAVRKVFCIHATAIYLRSECRILVVLFL